MPLLTRVVGTPLTIDIGSGTVARLAPLLADRRISSGGHVAVVVGPGLGEEIADSLREQLSNAELWRTDAGGVEEATALARRLREGFYDALVGIGGGRTLDLAKYAASLSGLPMVAVATSLAHDGLASPVASLEDHGRKGSYGVQMPIAVMVDLDYVRRSDVAMRRGGVGDVISNLSAIADWRLAERVRGETVDGVAVTFARTAATSIVHRGDGVDDDAFLIALAEALVLSGLAMATAGSSRPCSGGDHEILHAIDHLFPGTARPRRAGGRGQPVHRLPARRRRAASPGSTPACAATGCRARRPTSGSARTSSCRPCCTRRRPGRTATPCSSTSGSTRRARGRASGRSPRPTGRPRCRRSPSCAPRPSRPRSSRATAASTGPGGCTCAARRRT